MPGRLWICSRPAFFWYVFREVFVRSTSQNKRVQIDMLVEFNTAYYYDASRAHLETNRLKIAWRYTRTWLIFDLLAVIPGEWLFGASSGADGTRLAKLARISRTFRLLRAFRILKMAKSRTMRDTIMWLQHGLAISPMWNPLLRDFWVSALLIHMGAGLWHFIGLREIDIGNNSWILAEGQQDSSPSERYVTSLYWTISTLTSVGYGDVAAANQSEELLSVAYMLMGVVGAGVIVADILTIKDRMASVTKVQADRTAAVDRLIHRVRPPWALKVSLKNWVDEANSKLHETYDVLPQLPPELRREVILHMRWDVADAIKIFHLKEVSSALTADFLWYMKRVSVKASDFVYIQHTPAEFMYFIMTGEVIMMQEKERPVSNVSFRATKGKINKGIEVEPLYTLERGDNFGDEDVLFKDRYVCSAFCAKQAELYAMERRHIEQLCQENSSLYIILRKKARDDARRRKKLRVMAEARGASESAPSTKAAEAKALAEDAKAQPSTILGILGNKIAGGSKRGISLPPVIGKGKVISEDSAASKAFNPIPSKPAAAGSEDNSPTSSPGLAASPSAGVQGWRKAIQWAQLRNLENEMEEAEEDMEMDIATLQTGRFGRVTDSQVQALPSVQRMQEMQSKRAKARWRFAKTAIIDHIRRVKWHRERAIEAGQIQRAQHFSLTEQVSLSLEGNLPDNEGGSFLDSTGLSKSKDPDSS